jgi:SWI/SNF-related matrix-associated actin-dependent regulator of chromatin subfamily A member 5
MVQAPGGSSSKEPHRRGAGGGLVINQPVTIENGVMRDYQVEGLGWFIRLQQEGCNGILADEMGLGKTVQAIGVLAYNKEHDEVAGPHLVVVPTTTLANWGKEFAHW